MRPLLITTIAVADVTAQECIKRRYPYDSYESADKWNEHASSRLPYNKIKFVRGKAEKLPPFRKDDNVDIFLPETFTWRNVAGVSLLTPILNQHIPTYCGSCWLHAGTVTMQDRIKVGRWQKAMRERFPTATETSSAYESLIGLGSESEEFERPILVSEDVILSSGKKQAGSCYGGSDTGLYEFAQKTGLPEDSCQVYDATDEHGCSPERVCMNCDPTKINGTLIRDCYPVTRFGKWHPTEFGMIAPTAKKSGSKVDADEWENYVEKLSTKNEHASTSFPEISWLDTMFTIQAEIYLRGPVACSVDSDFLINDYMPGRIAAVPFPETGQDKWGLDHEIGISGWGETSGDKFTPLEMLIARNDSLAKKILPSILDKLNLERTESNPNPRLPFWNVRNSWGTAWGEQGWVRVLRGVNMIGIEGFCSWVVMETEPRIKDYGPPKGEKNRFFKSVVESGEKGAPAVELKKEEQEVTMEYMRASGLNLVEKMKESIVEKVEEVEKEAVEILFS